MVAAGSDVEQLDYDWVPHYQAIARALMAYEARQAELLAFLRSLPAELPVLPLDDRIGDGSVPLGEIDPFTFFAAFNRRIKDENRKEIIRHVQRFLGLVEDPPSGFSGIPIVNNMQSWFFPYAQFRDKDDIPSLWRLARQAVDGGLDGVQATEFDRCLAIRKVKIGKLTMGLFWIRPDAFYPCDGNSKRLFARHGFAVPDSHAAYVQLMRKLTESLGTDYPAISRAAWSFDDSGADPDPDPDPDPGHTRVYREDPEVARVAVEGFYSDPRHREAAAQFLAASIRRAHREGPGSWGVTLARRRHKIRLNVGRILLVDLFRDMIRPTLAWSKLDEASRAVLDQWVEKEAGKFALVAPDAACLRIPITEFVALDASVRDRLIQAHDALVDEMAMTRSPFKRAHSPGVLAYLRSVGNEVPDPEYGGEDPWDEFVRWGKLVHSFPGNVESERAFKLDIASRARLAQEGLDSGAEEWLPLLRSVFSGSGGITFFMDHQRLLEWASAHPDRAQRALEALWEDGASPREQVDGFNSVIPNSVLRSVGSRTNVASVLLGALGPEELPHYRSTTFAKGYELTGTTPPPSDATPGQHYGYALEFLDRMRSEFASRGLELQDRLDAQSVLWCLANATRDEAPVEAGQLEELLRYVGESPSVWLVQDQVSDTAVVEDGQVWVAAERMSEGGLASDLRLDRMKSDEVVLRVRDGSIWGISSVRQRGANRRRPGGGDADGRRVRLDTAELADPIALDEIPAALRALEPDVFDDSGRLREGLVLRLSGEFSAQLREHFGDRWPEVGPWPPVSARRYWLFEARPERVDLDAWLREVDSGAEGEWPVERFGDQIHRGDPVVLWQSGGEAGAHAIGEITGEVYDRPEEQADGRASRAVRFRLDRRLESPLRLARVREAPALSAMEVVREPSGTNYRLTREQWQALESLIVDAPPPVVVDVAEIHAAIVKQGLRIPARTLRRFHHSLATRGFVILSGPSGTGKTWLTECYARAIGARFELVAVAPSWTSNEDLLGHWNPLDGKYHHTRFSRFLREAANEADAAEEEGRPARKFVAVLDEMNLARVEHYFAEFLSRMEVRARGGRAKIELGPDEQTWLTSNLLFVGTVNVDETTHAFADKVYDRAQTLELSVQRSDLEAHVAGQSFAELLLEIWDAVEPVAPFAFRVADEISKYVEEAARDGVPWEEAFDEQVLQKVLTRLSGTDPRIGLALDSIQEIAQGRLDLTAAKAARMLADYNAHGITSYF